MGGYIIGTWEGPLAFELIMGVPGTPGGMGGNDVPYPYGGYDANGTDPGMENPVDGTLPY